MNVVVFCLVVAYCYALRDTFELTYDSNEPIEIITTTRGRTYTHTNETSSIELADIVCKGYGQRSASFEDEDADMTVYNYMTDLFPGKIFGIGLSVVPGNKFKWDDNTKFKYNRAENVPGTDKKIFYGMTMKNTDNPGSWTGFFGDAEVAGHICQKVDKSPSDIL
ncbi:unnamed protein product [Bursaphelenchus okinawaensis]|uniref:C-type lectin domain-containing protein n=1 Tax=Bursaphelenchus okinawaensis TaxID=465554 RepID=A0A811K0Z6_9BILA|nr:unnamed protein product [Bursaphelenchus okinawaensis]CAG9088634.1 unnamed protein product [Bursaphelenchus okinawaensis]